MNQESFSFVIYIIHTQSTSFVIDDITEYLNVRGVKI